MNNVDNIIQAIKDVIIKQSVDKSRHNVSETLRLLIAEYPDEKDYILKEINTFCQECGKDYCKVEFNINDDTDDKKTDDILVELNDVP